MRGERESEFAGGRLRARNLKEGSPPNGYLKILTLFTGVQMSRFLALLLLLCAVLCAAEAKAADPREVELKKVRGEFWKYFATGDVTGMATIVTDDFVQFTSTATFLDKAAFLTSLKTGKYKKVENPVLDDVVDPRVRFYGTVAIVTYSAPLAAEPGSIDAATPRTRVTEIWAKVEGKGWKMANFQVTLPQPASVAPPVAK